MRDYNPPDLTELYAVVRQGTPTLRYMCADCSRWVIRVFSLPTVSLVAVREEVSLLDHEMNRDSLAQVDPMSALRNVTRHPRSSKTPFLSTMTSLVAYQGDRTLTAFCCKTHFISIDELATDLERGVESRVSQPDTP